MINFPKFKYHPNPIDNKVFVLSDKTCPCCGNETGYSYVGPFYALDEVEDICPWCIASGRAAEKYDATFVDEDEITEQLSEEQLEHLTRRTPGFFFPQSENWVAHCGDYCQISGFVTWEDIDNDFCKYKNDLFEISKKLELTESFLLNEFKNSQSSLRFYIFKCPSCPYEKLDADYD